LLNQNIKDDLGGLILREKQTKDSLVPRLTGVHLKKMIVQEPVILRKSALQERERQADVLSAARRRGCFITQLICGLLFIILQLADILFFHAFDSSGTHVTRQAVPGLWAGVIFALVGGVHLLWKPETPASLFVSIATQVLSILAWVGLCCALLFWPLSHGGNSRIDWPTFALVVYSAMLLPVFIQIFAIIISLRLTGSKCLRSQGYLEEGIRDDSLLNQNQNIM